MKAPEALEYKCIATQHDFDQSSFWIFSTKVQRYTKGLNKPVVHVRLSLGIYLKTVLWKYLWKVTRFVDFWLNLSNYINLRFEEKIELIFNFNVQYFKYIPR